MVLDLNNSFNTKDSTGFTLGYWIIRRQFRRIFFRR